MDGPMHSMNHVSSARPSSPLVLCLLFLVPAGTLCFDLGTVLMAFDDRYDAGPCPNQCSCTTRRAGDLMQDYVSKYLPLMGQHMNVNLESDMRSFMALMTSWVGKMADIRCLLTEAESLSLSDVMEASLLSFRSVRIHCQPGARVVWDLPPISNFLNVLDVSGCSLEKNAKSGKMALPRNIWILDLEDVRSETAESLDISTAAHLRVLSYTHSRMSKIPELWSDAYFQNLIFLNLANNRLRSYDCEVKAQHLMAVNLDNNHFSALPSCVMIRDKYSSHLSLRHNRIENLEPVEVSMSEPIQLQPKLQLYSLDLAHNKLSSVRALGKIQGFLGLDISYNRLVSIASDTFSRLPGIVWLDISNNLLDFLPDGLLSNLVTMHHLNLSHNHLRVFDYDQSPCSSKVVRFDLRHNRLIYPPFAGNDYMAPLQFRIASANNPFRCDCNIDVFLEMYSKPSRSEEEKRFQGGKMIRQEGEKTKNQVFIDVNDMICSQPADMKGVHLSSLSFQESCPLLQRCPQHCKCKLVRSDTTYVSVDCSQLKDLTELPPGLPTVTNTPIVLYVNQSNLKRLDHRPYLHLLTELYASYNLLSSVTAEAVEALENVSVLDLHSNRLRSLPAVTQKLLLPSVTNISLGGNPWTCGCQDLWMPDWLSKHSAALFDTENVRCRWTGKLVTDLSPSDLSCGVFSFLPLAIAATILIGLTTLCISWMVTYRLEVLVFIHSRFRLRPFNMFIYDQTKPYLFDVFVSFSQHDYKWVAEKLVDQLENRARPFRMCISLRDFPAAAPIADSITWAVENSRCTLLVLTRELLKNEWSQQYFCRAHTSLMKEPKTKLLVVVHGPLDARGLEKQLLIYMRSHVYLKTEDRMFWAKLEYALPDPQETILMMMPRSASVCQAKIRHDIELDRGLPTGMAAGDVITKGTDISISSSVLSEFG